MDVPAGNGSPDCLVQVTLGDGSSVGRQLHTNVTDVVGSLMITLFGDIDTVNGNSAKKQT